MKHLIRIFVFAFFSLISLQNGGAFYLPDTGQTNCYSSKGRGREITCPAPGEKYAQDGSYSVNPPSYILNNDRTLMTDKNTKLMWQREDDGIARNWNDAIDYCKGLTLGEYTDWRLPTEKELASIINYGSSYFGLLWTSDSFVIDPDHAYLITYDGAISHTVKSGNFYVRCVREKPLNFGDFKDNGDGTVTDSTTGLMWQQEEPGMMSWGYALNYCEGLLLGGYTDWRLPNARELDSLTDVKRYNPAVNALFSPASYYYWSSTTYMNETRQAWAINFSDSNSYHFKKSDDLYTRCVRKGKTPYDDGEITVSTQDLGFGIIRVGSSLSKILTVTNIGTADVSISSIASPSAPFYIASDGCSGQSLPASKSCAVTVTFTPVADGMFTDTCTITSNDVDNPNIIITLVGNTRFLFPDTGQKSCFDGDRNIINCPSPGDQMAQDGSYTINPILLTKSGDGTVTDNNTGLMWQQEDDGQTYNWYEASGSYDKRYNSRSANVCGTPTTGGYADWRLPTRKELASIARYDYDPTYSSIFSNMKSYYWSSTSVSGNPDAAWYVQSDGKIMSSGKTLSLYVRCVRGEELAFGNFTDNSNGTVTDNLTGLMWQKYSASSTSWASDLSHCEGLTLGGHTDWRLANIKELESITDDNRLRPAINPAVFPGIPSYDYVFFWSSTRPNLYVNLSTGFVDDYIDLSMVLGCDWGLYTCASFIRCVRGNTISEPSAAALTGIVTDSSTGLPIPNVSVTVNDSLGTHSATTNLNGVYTLSNLSQGSFTATFEKSGYIKQTVNGILTAGEILTLNVQLTPFPPLTINITSPLDGAVVNSSVITVTGNVSNGAQVTVNGSQATVTGDTFSATVFLREGANTITATAIDQYGQTASHSITVTLVILNPPTISDMTVSDITADSATVSWSTDQPSDSLVEYGETTAYGSEKTDSTLTTSHSIHLNGLIPDTTYHFRVISKNADGLSSLSGDNTFTTLKFSAVTIGDYGNITVMEITGNYDSKNPDGSINALPRQEIAKEFFRTHNDEYDFFVIFSKFDFTMPETEAKAFYLEVKNDTQGIGKPILDDSGFYGSNSKLQGIIDMGNLSNHGTDPIDPKFEDTLTTLAHEQMHRWGASVKFKDSNGNISNALLGKDGTHWSFLLDSDASVMYGNDWKDNGDGTFTSTGKEKYYSALDLYLAGFYSKAQVQPMLLIDNSTIDPARLPEVGITVSGTPKTITIEDIIAEEGERIPNASQSQKSFKTAFILITAPNTFTGNELPGIENIRNGWAGRFASLTNGKGSITDVIPSITIAISSPSDGQTINRPDVMVKGAIINNMGNETGVTVNGMVANLYGNQFIANHVPLVEGANTITVTATDTAGNTATTSIMVNAITTGNYIRITANPESGISPLEVVLRVDGSFSIIESNLNITGSAQPEIVTSTPEEYQVKFIAEGVYYITASSTGSDNITYQDTIVITVFNKTQLDALLKGKWEGMKKEFIDQNVDAAVAYFLNASQSRYRYIFTTLLSSLPDIAAAMQAIEMISVEGQTAEYRIKRLEDEGEITYYIYFTIDGDGLWKIQQF